MPIMPRRIAAMTGAKMLEAKSAVESMPLTRPYCSFGTIVVMAAEYAGN